MAGGNIGGVFPRGVLVLAGPTAFASVYWGKPPPGLDSASEVPAAKIGAPSGTPGARSPGPWRSIAVVLNEGKTEKAGFPPPIGLAPALMVGGPSKDVAVPWASSEFPWGILAMRVTSCPPAGGDSGGSVVAGWVTQMPGSMCSAPPVVASLICTRYVK